MTGFTPPRGLHATQLAANPFAAVGALTSPGGRQPAETPRYGMTMWFEVAVENVALGQGATRNLGAWSACKGLGVELQIEELLWSGGDYGSPYYMPKRINYGNITLERAMTAGDSRDVQEWLKTVAASWIGGDQAGAGLVGAKVNNQSAGARGYRGSTVVIRLFCSMRAPADSGPPKAGRGGKANAPAVKGAGSEAHEIASWTLRDAIPISWKGPDLNTKGGDVAIESLTLVHRGFLPDTRSGPLRTPQASQDQGKFTLRYKQEEVTFQYNPTDITLERVSPIKDAAATLRSPENYHEEGKLNISVSRVHIEGAEEVKEKCAKLYDWIEAEDVGGKAMPKIVTVTMGAGEGLTLKEDVHLKQVKCEYVRFTNTGVPNRAKVTLTLVVVPKDKPVAGQPSGDAPRGSAHVVKGGDTMPSVAAGSGKQPADYRSVAESNNIDDTLRLRRGESLNLGGKP
ncbi:phage tail protein [Actinokineospora sp. 24-640]